MSTPTPRPAVEALLATLGEEVAMLRRLDAGFGEQLRALRDRDRTALDAATNTTNETVHTLDRLRQQRERQLGLVARLLGVADARVLPVADALATTDASDLADALRGRREEVRARAEAAQRQGQSLEFALQYAMNLGRDVVATLGGAQQTSGQGYTAGGRAAAATSGRGLVNTVG